MFFVSPLSFLWCRASQRFCGGLCPHKKGSCYLNEEQPPAAHDQSDGTGSQGHFELNEAYGVWGFPDSTCIYSRFQRQGIWSMYTGIFVCQDPGESVHVKMHFTCQDCSLTPHKNSVFASKNNYFYRDWWSAGAEGLWSHGLPWCQDYGWTDYSKLQTGPT